MIMQIFKSQWRAGSLKRIFQYCMYLNFKLTRPPMGRCFHYFLQLLSLDQEACIKGETEGEWEGERGRGRKRR